MRPGRPPGMDRWEDTGGSHVPNPGDAAAVSELWVHAARPPVPVDSSPTPTPTPQPPTGPKTRGRGHPRTPTVGSPGRSRWWPALSVPSCASAGNTSPTPSSTSRCASSAPSTSSASPLRSGARTWLLAYLATRTDPVTADTIRDAVWAGAGVSTHRVYTSTSPLRAALGPSVLPSGGPHGYQLTPGRVTTDLARLQYRVSYAGPDAAVCTLVQAINLISGQPFTTTTNDDTWWRWAQDDTLAAAVEAPTADIAHRLSLLVREERGDLDLAHDLRVAGFSGTVSDEDCDNLFYYLMEAHCNDRAFLIRTDCRLMRDAAFLAVSTPGVVSDPSPGLVEIRNVATGRCTDVEGPSTANNAPLHQWQCVGVSNQRFRIHPAPGSPGRFQIRAEHSGKCARAFSTVKQYDCVNGWNSERFRIQGALNQNKYSLRGAGDWYVSCWQVPGGFSNGTDLAHPTCNDNSNWYIWRILRAD